MKIIRKIFGKIYFLYNESIKELHFSILLLTLLLTFLLKNKNVTIEEDIYIHIINGMGILTSFFILVIDKININEVNKRFTSKRSINFGKREINTGNWISNTLFSLITTMFFLLGLAYILLLFNRTETFLLVLLIVNIFFGFLFALITWSFLEEN